MNSNEEPNEKDLDWRAVQETGIAHIIRFSQERREAEIPH
jgi:hypothetical protein